MAKEKLYHRNMTEKDLQRYYELTEQAKKMDKELKALKKQFNLYFDELVGEQEKAEACLGEYKIQRQIRHSESFDDEKTVQRLEELGLNECIEQVKKPIKEKIEAEITLGLLDAQAIEDCRVHKTSKAIIVKKV